MNAQSLWEDIRKIREKAPLVHNITNYVVMNNSANALLALGASPVMAHARKEIIDIVRISSSLVVNIGTLNDPWIESMKLAVKTAKDFLKPIVLDPVGAGASEFRTETVHQLLDIAAPDVIRGNASEILAVFSSMSKTKGVDSTHTSEDALGAAQSLSARYGCTISISGAVDLIVQDKKVARVSNGHSMMPKVTGLGCTASALTGAFLAVNPEAFLAATHAMGVMGIAGEIAAERSAGPGSLQMNFLDVLFQIEKSDIEKRLKLEESSN